MYFLLFVTSLHYILYALILYAISKFVCFLLYSFLPSCLVYIFMLSSFLCLFDSVSNPTFVLYFGLFVHDVPWSLLLSLLAPQCHSSTSASHGRICTSVHRHTITVSVPHPLISASMHRCINILAQRCISKLVYRHIGASVHPRHISASVHNRASEHNFSSRATHLMSQIGFLECFCFSVSPCLLLLFTRMFMAFFHYCSFCVLSDHLCSNDFM